MVEDDLFVNEPEQIPSILHESEILIPIKVDVTTGGARFVDTICWRLQNSLVTPDEFAWRTCSDLNLPLAFQSAISLQIQEQIQAYREVLAVLKIVCMQGIRPPWKSLFTMTIGIRHLTLDYQDKFQWDVDSTSGVTPEVIYRHSDFTT